jgi:hypothetical protein
MISWVKIVFAGLCCVGWERKDLVLEVMALRQQVLVLQRKRPRPKLSPETVELIRTMWVENPTWGSPKIRRELLKLGIRLCKSTVQKYKPRGKTPDGQRWMTFLRNHMNSIIAVDFFTVPTVTFRVLYVFIILQHERRRVLHFNITESTTAAWTGQHVVNAFPFAAAPKYLLRDRDGIYGEEFKRRVRPHKSLEDDSPDGREVEDDKSKEIVALPVLGGLHHHYTRQAA